MKRPYKCRVAAYSNGLLVLALSSKGQGNVRELGSQYGWRMARKLPVRKRT